MTLDKILTKFGKCGWVSSEDLSDLIGRRHVDQKAAIKRIKMSISFAAENLKIKRKHGKNEEVYLISKELFTLALMGTIRTKGLWKIKEAYIKHLFCYGE